MLGLGVSLVFVDTASEFVGAIATGDNLLYNGFYIIYNGRKIIYN